MEEPGLEGFEVEAGWLAPVAMSSEEDFTSELSGDPYYAHEYGEEIASASLQTLEALLPEPIALPYAANADEDSCPLLTLPPEMLTCVASFLHSGQLATLRASCHALCKALDARMQRLHLGSRHLPANSASYHCLTPSWLSHVKTVCLEESALDQPRPWHAVAPHGCSPVCLWLLLFGPRLSNLSKVQLYRLPYLLEALLVLQHACPAITWLDVLKPAHQELNMQAFWLAVASFRNLQRFELEGWTLSLVDLHGLESLTQLSHLHIKRCTNYPTGLRCLSALTNLRSLTLEEIEYPGTIPHEFCGLSRLTRLHTMRFVTVGPLADEIEALCSLSELRHLEISQHHDEHLIPALFTLMSAVTSLRILTLPQFELTDGFVQSLAKQSRITRLMMGRYRLVAPRTDSARPATHSTVGGSARAGAGGAAAVRPSAAALAALSGPGSQPAQPNGHASATISGGVNSPSSTAADGLHLASGARTSANNNPLDHTSLEGLLPSARWLSLRCPLPSGFLDLHGVPEPVPVLPLASAMPGVSQLELLPSLAPHLLGMPLGPEGIQDVERATEMLRVPLQHLTSLTTFAPLLTARATTTGFPHLVSLTLESCQLQIHSPGSPPQAAGNVGNANGGHEPPIAVGHAFGFGPWGGWLGANAGGNAGAGPEGGPGAAAGAHGHAEDQPMGPADPGGAPNGADAPAQPLQPAGNGWQDGGAWAVDEPPHVNPHAIQNVQAALAAANAAAAAAAAAAADPSTSAHGIGPSSAPSYTASAGQSVAPPPSWLLHLSLLRSLRRLDMQLCDTLSKEDSLCLVSGLPKQLEHLRLRPSIGAKLGPVCLSTVGSNLHRLQQLDLWRAGDITPKAIVQLLNQRSSLTTLHLLDCSPATQAQCDLIARRYHDAGRRGLDIAFNPDTFDLTGLTQQWDNADPSAGEFGFEALEAEGEGQAGGDGGA